MRRDRRSRSQRLLSPSFLALAETATARAPRRTIELLDNLPEVTNATAINFLEYGKESGAGRRRRRYEATTATPRRVAAAPRRKSCDVMLVTGRFGLKAYSLRDPANPRLLDEITAEELRLEGDPPVDFSPDAARGRRSGRTRTWTSTSKRKLALLSRDPRAYAGSTTREPGEPDPNGATNIAGVYVIDAKDPERSGC